MCTNDMSESSPSQKVIHSLFAKTNRSKPTSALGKPFGIALSHNLHIRGEGVRPQQVVVKPVPLIAQHSAVVFFCDVPGHLDPPDLLHYVAGRPLADHAGYAAMGTEDLVVNCGTEGKVFEGLLNFVVDCHAV